ncbi:TlpA family protein disulfide reductase [Mucilaginibacter auburnensis]|uniref:Thiol-disulfide isomerase/thioredoxin n=1 Tax=Mucilaginibacter auburnensis TaxID=1457233 RepID=A0A2H9VUB1_9SPHI|nr:TlpA disulfide reductase family protein [Mucilaginibacter auburnensis]PJJ84407.1 thiol-disulfide isomerase/thioredoxin [Mucilaginibacter auburnensis]
MFKTFLFTLITLCCLDNAAAQKNFNITVKIDNKFNADKISFQYHNGKRLISMPDSFGNKKVLVLKGKYYTPLVALNITYIDDSNKNYSNNYFLTEKPAFVSLRYEQNDNEILPVTSVKNATAIFDTVANKDWASLHRFVNDESVEASNKAFYDFLEHNQPLTQDSRHRLGELYKPYLNRAMLYFKEHPDNYFSFWHFTYQIAQPNGMLWDDIAFLKEQLAFYRSTFPSKYINSVEGRTLISKFEKRIYPLKINEPAPVFKLITTDGKNVSSNTLKGKYVLFDFWATWCGPCMAAVPFVKGIRTKYASDKLAIIGINKDSDMKNLLRGAKTTGMSWPQFYDKHDYMTDLYEVGAIPVLVLIDPDGKLIYKSDLKTPDEKALPEVLKALEEKHLLN